eukprot:COSAG05_NODE_4102_length_1673_cov_2.445997_1_plen_189_part_10
MMPWRQVEEQAEEMLRLEQRRALEVARASRERRWAKAKAAAATKLAREEQAEAGRVELRWRIEASKAQAAVEQLRADKARAVADGSVSIVESRRQWKPRQNGAVPGGSTERSTGTGKHGPYSAAVAGASFGRAPTGRVRQPSHYATPTSLALSAKTRAKLSRSEQLQRRQRRVENTGSVRTGSAPIDSW